MSQDRLGKLSPLLSNTALFGNENPIEKMVFFKKVGAVIYPLYLILQWMRSMF